MAAHKQADASHARFRDESSDFAGLLKLWDWYQEARARLSRSALRRHCRETFVSEARMREWTDIHAQLAERCREMGYRPQPSPARADSIHRALLAGLLGRVGMWQPEKRTYAGARQLRFMLHPSSGLARKPPAWVFAAEIVETSQPFARLAAALQPGWVEQVAGPQCKRSYHHPHWQERPAHVVASEQVSLFGLPLVRDRRVHYGPIAPGPSRQLFLLHALVRHEFSSQGAFLEHNRAVLQEAKRLRDKARRSDLLYDEDALLPFFEERVPEGVYSGKTFETWRACAESTNPDILRLSLADVLQGEVGELSPALYPDSLELYGSSLALSYRFAPAEEDDGLTLHVPIALLAQADSEQLNWTIPGWHAEKILLLLESLPKSLRKDLAPLAELGRELAAVHKPFEGPMLPSLARTIQEWTGVRIPPSAWRLDELPRHLGLTFRIVGPDGKTIAQSRDLRALQHQYGVSAQELWNRAPRLAWERDQLSSWDFARLPEPTPLRVGGVAAIAWPALVDDGQSVSLRALPSEQAAERASRRGVRKLLLLQLGDSLERLERLVPASGAFSALAAQVADNAAQLRTQLVARVVDELFGLREADSLPRQRTEFMARAVKARASLRPRISELAALVSDIALARMQVASKLESLAGKPGAAPAALRDASEQLSTLFPKGLLTRASWERLSHYPRYLRAIQVRLERLPHDPRRDADKAAQIVPLWQSFLQHQSALRLEGEVPEQLESFRWMLEELRVSLFAPELKPAVPVSAQMLAVQWKAWKR